MISVTHYVYVLSTRCLVAEDAIAQARAHFGSALSYDWRIAPTDYGANERLTLEQLEFFYARLEASTGQRMSTDWWYEGYDWLVPDRVVVAARRLGCTDSSVSKLRFYVFGSDRSADKIHEL